MTDTGSYRIEEINRNVDQELERLRVQTLLGWHKEARGLAWFGLRDGMSVLELGSGPGFVTEQLLGMLPHSVITALEIDPLMIDIAEKHLRDLRADRVRFVAASIMQIPLPEASYDFAFARFLFQHLPDPVAAAKEVLRVLKPGGKLVIHDVDGEIGGVVDPAPSPEATAILEKAGKLQTQKGGNAQIGRRLPRILKAAGFTNVDLDIVVIHSDLADRNEMRKLWNADMLIPAIKAGLVTQEEFALLHTENEAYYNSPDSLDMYTLLFASGQKTITS